MNKWVVLAVSSLMAISLFSIYVMSFISQGIMCNYVAVMPYLLPGGYVLGLALGYAIPQITRPKRDPKELAALFQGDEKKAVMAAIENQTQADLSSEIGKVKAHRTLKKLEREGVVERKEHGNSYKLAPGRKLKKLI